MGETVDIAAELAELRAEVARLRAELERVSVPQRAHLGPTSRRDVLRRGALAVAAGTVAATWVGRPAVAGDGDPVKVGQGHTGTGTTSISSSGNTADAIYGSATATSGQAWGVRGDSASSLGVGVHARALSAAGATAAVRAIASSPDGVGVDASNEAVAGGIGVRGTTDSSSGTGVLGAVKATTGTGLGTGVYGVSNSPNATGVLGAMNATSGIGDGVRGVCDSPGGRGVHAVHFTSGFGLTASSVSGVGAELAGPRASVRLHPSGPPPRSAANPSLIGALYVDTNGALWACVESGTPGTWQKLAGPTASGSVHAIAPIRAYDSRFGGGRLASGENRLVPIRDAIDVVSGAVTTKNAIPPGATAVLYNVACVGTTAAGWLAVQPGDTSKVTAASINWYATGQTLANASFVRLDGSRRARVFAGGASGAACDFVIDVTGYTL